MQTLYKFALEPIAEITADPNSYGFRAKRCVPVSYTHLDVYKRQPIFHS